MLTERSVLFPSACQGCISGQITAHPTCLAGALLLAGGETLRTKSQIKLGWTLRSLERRVNPRLIDGALVFAVVPCCSSFLSDQENANGVEAYQPLRSV